MFKVPKVIIPKSMYNILPFLISLFILINHSFSKDLYVGDLCPGSPPGSTIYRTLAEAVAVADDGDRIIIFPGYYDESLRIEKDITLIPCDGNRIVIGASNIHYENYYAYMYPRSTVADAATVEQRYQNVMRDAIQAYINGNINETIRLCQIVLPSLPKHHGPNNRSIFIDVLEERFNRSDQLFSNFEIDLLKADWNTKGSIPEKVFGSYYYEKFVTPMLLCDALTTNGNFPQALKALFKVYAPLELYSKLSNQRENELKDFYTQEIDVGILVSSFVSNEYGRNGTTQLIHDIERRFVKLKAANIYLKWGNFLYKNERAYEAQSKYAQILRIFYPIWEEVLKNGKNESINQFNPAVVKLVFLAHRELIKIQRNLNYLGYQKDYTPIWDYSFLRESARYFIEQAKSLERDALNFLASAEKEQEQRLLVENSISIAKQTVALESAKVREARTSVGIARKNVELAATKMANKSDQIDLFEEHHKSAVQDYQNDLRDLGFNLEDLDDHLLNLTINPTSTIYLPFNNPVTELIEDIGKGIPFIGGLFGRGQRIRAEKEQYQRLLHEKIELQISAQAAGLEVTRAMQADTIATISLAIAHLDFLNKSAHLEFLEQKILNEQFWFELSKNIREIAHQYLDYAIYQAWLAEQAYEAQYLNTVDIIKFEYLSASDWLAADQLLLDLNSIEHLRIISKQEKDIPITYYLSLRLRNLFDLQELKRQGEVFFTTTQPEFDFAYPGTYNRRIEDVEVFIPALVGQGGISGSLTKSEFSLIKTLQPSFTSKSERLTDDWLEYTPSPYKTRLLRSQEETLIISAIDPNRTAVKGRQFEQKNIFEGHGVTGQWILKLPKYANDFDYNTITDVILKINFTANYDETLKTLIEIERRKLQGINRFPLGNIDGLSVRQNLPDEFYFFHNPIADPNINDRTRLIPILVSRDAFPANQVQHKPNQLWIGTYGFEKPLKVKITSRALSSDLQFEYNNQLTLNDVPLDINSANLQWFEDFDVLINPQTGDSTNVLLASSLETLGAELFDLWILRIDAIDNPQLRNENNLAIFDPEKISKLDDIIIQFGYDYQPPGIQGTPIVTWAEFKNSEETPVFYQATYEIPADTIGWRKHYWTAHGGEWEVHSGQRVLKHNGSPAERHSLVANVDSLPDEFEINLLLNTDPHSDENDYREAGLSFMTGDDNDLSGYTVLLASSTIPDVEIPGLTISSPIRPIPDLPLPYRVGSESLRPGFLGLETHFPDNSQSSSSSMRKTWQSSLYKGRTGTGSSIILGNIDGTSNFLRLRILSRNFMSGNIEKRFIRVYLNSRLIHSFVDNNPLDNSGKIKLVAKGNAKFGQLLVADLEGRTDIPVFD